MKIFSILSILLISALISSQLKAQTEYIVPYSGSKTITICDQLIYDYGGSTGGLSQSNADGSLTIYPSTPGTMIALSIAALEIDHYSDFLYIYNGESTSAPLIGTLNSGYSGSDAGYAGEYYGKNPKGAITVRLKTTFVYASASGMVLRARCTPIGELNNMVRNQKRVINSCNTTIYDNGGSAGNYFNNSTDTMLILPDAPNKIVQLNFQFTSVNNEDGLDQIYFLGGLKTAGSYLYAISGYGTAGNLGTSLNPNGSASFVFQSDASYVGAGFRAVVSCINRTATPLTESIVPINGNASIITCNATISDNGDKYNYFPNSNGSLTINPLQTGTKAMATFSQFNLGEGDYINFYDGANTSAPLIAKYTNTSTANPINATNITGALTVQFVSDALDQGTGFVFNASCMIPTSVASIITTPSISAINQYDQIQLSADVLPTNSTNKKVIWSSSDITIAKVSATGLVTTLLPGLVTITAQSEEFPNIKGTSSVTVKDIPVTAIILNPSPANVQIGLTAKITATFQPANASYKQVTWSSSDPSLVSVNSTGIVTGIAFGTATITAINSDGNITANCSVTVIPVSVTKILLSPATATIPGNGSIQLSVTVTPANAANQQITWSSSNDAIVTVNNTGFVTGVSTGIATITAKSVDGNFTSSSKITVSPTKVTGITLTENTAEIAINNTLQLNPIVQPDNASNKQITWITSDANIATVSTVGIVNGIALGSAIITAKTTDGNFTATTTITVIPIQVTGISIAENTIEVYLSKTIEVVAVVTPANSTNKEINWTSSDEKIATVNPSGVVTGISIGSAIITAKTTDGNFTATVTIVVKQAPTTNIALGLSNKSILIYPNPSEGSFNVKFPIPFDTIEITNALGQTEILQSSNLNFNTNLKGLLIIKISTEQGSYFSKLIVN